MRKVRSYHRCSPTSGTNGPLRAVIVSPVSGQEATDSYLWSKYVSKVEVLP